MKHNSERSLALKHRIAAVGIVVGSLCIAVYGTFSGNHGVPANESMSSIDDEHIGGVYPGLNHDDKEILDNTNLSERQKRFIKFTWPKIVQKKRNGEPIFPVVVAAQTIIESNFGRNAPNNVFFGVKSTGSEPAGVHLTKEKINGQYVPIEASFRHYSSFDSSLDGYVGLIKRAPWYRDAREASTWQGYLQGLQHDSINFDVNGKPKIYASAGSDYEKLVTDVINSYNLDQLSS